MPAALNRAQHHPDSMRPRRHCSSSPAFGTPQRCRSNEEIAVTQSRHSAPPTECRDYSAERCRGALERGGVPQRRRHPSSRNEPFVPLLTGVVEMRQPAPPCSKRPRSWGSRRSPPGRGGACAWACTSTRALPAQRHFCPDLNHLDTLRHTHTHSKHTCSHRLRQHVAKRLRCGNPCDVEAARHHV